MGRHRWLLLLLLSPRRSSHLAAAPPPFHHHRAAAAADADPDADDAGTVAPCFESSHLPSLPLRLLQGSSCSAQHSLHSSRRRRSGGPAPFPQFRGLHTSRTDPRSRQWKHLAAAHRHRPVRLSSHPGGWRRRRSSCVWLLLSSRSSSKQQQRPPACPGCSAAAQIRAARREWFDRSSGSSHGSKPALSAADRVVGSEPVTTSHGVIAAAGQR